jgi:hypothetical protein
MKLNRIIAAATIGLGASLLALGCGGGGTRLTALDARAELNQQRAAFALIQRIDGGAGTSLAEAIYCSARGTLVRAGAPTMDGGIPCLQ